MLAAHCTEVLCFLGSCIRLAMLKPTEFQTHPVLRPEHKRSRKHFLKKWQREAKHLLRLNTICSPAGPSAADTSRASQPAPASSYCTVPLLPAWPSLPAAAYTGRNTDICFQIHSFPAPSHPLLLELPQGFLQKLELKMLVEKKIDL